jgi:hypothetical protein
VGWARDLTCPAGGVRDRRVAAACTTPYGRDSAAVESLITVVVRAHRTRIQLHASALVRVGAARTGCQATLSLSRPVWLQIE